MTALKRHIFLTRRTHEVERWRRAFPDAEVVSYSKIGTILVGGPGEALVWVHLDQHPAAFLSREAVLGGHPNPTAGERRKDEGPDDLVRLAVQLAPGCSVVALSNEVSQEEGLTCLEAGASGYTSALANPDVLRQIAMVVDNGGLWVGPELLARLRNSLAHMPAAHIPTLNGKLAALSPREREVALAVAAGASNKEVARSMGITERTVKAHLTAIFSRLGIRDRMQLVLMMNGTGQ
ncbi:MAG: LuxR C-terminal-related transcriptional regulator [Pseudomonadota bacterium]